MTWLRSRPIFRIAILSAFMVLTAAGYVYVSASHPGVLSKNRWLRQEYFLFGSLAALNLMLIWAMRRIFRTDSSELAQVSSLQRTVLDSSGPMILAIDAQGRFTAFNPSAEKILGYTSEEMLERRVLKYLRGRRSEENGQRTDDGSAPAR